MNYDIRLNADIRKRQNLKKQKISANLSKEEDAARRESSYHVEHHSRPSTREKDITNDNSKSTEDEDEDFAPLWNSAARKFSMIDEVKITDELAYDSQCGTGDIFYASRRGELRRVRQIVEREGGNVNLVRWSGVSPLHRAAGEGRLEVIKYLIKRGGDVNAKTTFGWHTPLHFACKNGHEEVSKLLIEKGALWKVYNKDRETPQNWARKGGHATMGRTLEHLVNMKATKHRREKMGEMEAQFKERRRVAELEKKAEEEEERRKEEEEDDRKKKYERGSKRAPSAHSRRAK